MRALSKRERILLAACLGTLFLMGNGIALQALARGWMKSSGRLAALRTEERQQRIWLGDREHAERMQRWLDEHQPVLQSEGKDQGELLQKLQDEAFERKLRLERQSLLEPRATPYLREVSVNVIVRGEMAQIGEWLTTLQKPESFLVIRNLELALDTSSREQEPQARCNLTVARWFKP
jgi:hypothetical protein